MHVYNLHASYYILYMQVVAECGRILSDVRRGKNLSKYSTKILEHAGFTTPAGQLTERDMMFVLEAIVKCLKQLELRVHVNPHLFPNTMYVIVCMH